ncbi:sensor domain-containing protein [Nocardia tengchongensis]|uniref:sensor domain-containing protein n=1 Tax=Nocardia tengchongensis TaxID=2055889 RepID=UPI0036848F45
MKVVVVAAVFALTGCGPAGSTGSGTDIEALLLAPKDVDQIINPAKAKTIDSATYAAMAADYTKDQETAPADAMEHLAGIRPQTCAVLAGIGFRQLYGSDFTAFRKRQIDKGTLQNTSSYEAVALYRSTASSAIATITTALQTCAGTKMPIGAAGANVLIDSVRTRPNAAEWTYHSLNPQVVDRQWNCAVRVTPTAVIEIELADGDAGAVADAVVKRVGG